MNNAFKKIPVRHRLTSAGRMRMPSYYPCLPKTEVAAYFIFYVGCVCYSVSHVYGISKENEDRYVYAGNLVSSNSAIKGKLKDASDDQWMMMTKFMWDIYLVGFTGHFVVARIMERIWWERRFHVLCLYGIAFTVYFFGFSGTILVIIHCAIQYIFAVVSKSVMICWATGFLLCLSLVDSISSEDSVFGFTFLKLVRPYQGDDDKADFLVFVVAMCNLRYIAFTLEYVWEQEAQKSDRLMESSGQTDSVEINSEGNGVPRRNASQIVIQRTMTAQRDFNGHAFSFFDLLTFQFYYPLMYGGPIMSYKRFVTETKNAPRSWSVREIGQFTFGILRFAFWIFFIDFSLHFYYLPSLSSDERIITKMPSFFHAFGLGVAQVGFFYIKHVILYGFPSHIATSDNFNAPKGPHCVYSKHRLTDMWKTFDQGLHEWLVRYIYFPLGGSKVKFHQLIINTFLPFLFTAIWHGGDHQYLYWAALSWMGVFAEGLALKIYRIKHVQMFEAKYLTRPWSRRIRAMLSSVMFGSTLTINVYFQSGMDIGNAYWNKFYHESFQIAILFHFTYYTGVQCCMELQRWKNTVD